MIFAPGLRGISPVLSLSFVASAVSNAATVIVPGSAAVGDLAVLFDCGAVSSFGSVPNVDPAGYTRIFEQGVALGFSSSRAVVNYRVLGVGEAGSSISGINATRNNKVLFVFRPSRALASVTPSVWTGHSTSGDPDPRPVSGSAGTPPLLVLGMAACDGATAAFSTASPAFSATVATATPALIAGYKIYNSAPADHTIDMNDLGNLNQLIAGYIAVSA